MTYHQISNITNRLRKITTKESSEEEVEDLLKTLSLLTIDKDTLLYSDIVPVVNNLIASSNNKNILDKTKSLIQQWNLIVGLKQNTVFDEPVTTEAKIEKLSSKIQQNIISNEIRMKCIILLEDALSTNLIGHTKSNNCYNPRELAIAIENKLYDLHKNNSLYSKDKLKKYKAVVRSKVFNLRAPKNPDLKKNVLTGVISIADFVKMTSLEMASQSLKNMRQEYTNQAISKYTLPIEAGIETDLFKCHKCLGKNCTYIQIQTRSADEPMTVFVFCRGCGNRWKA